MDCSQGSPLVVKIIWDCWNPTPPLAELLWYCRSALDLWSVILVEVSTNLSAYGLLTVKQNERREPRPYSNPTTYYDLLRPTYGNTAAYSRLTTLLDLLLAAEEISVSYHY